MVSVINYKAGNSPSVVCALKHTGIDCQEVSDASELEQASCIILPGVGAARATMDSLREMGCLEVLRHKVLDEKIPFLGVCVGMQVLFEQSEEEETQCLGWLEGQVLRYAGGQRVPQIGWNEVTFEICHPVVAGLGTSQYFYFVNSYYVVPEKAEMVLGKTEYGDAFCSMVAWENIVATQFHVEKSGPAGLRLLANFIALSRRSGPC